MPLPQQLRRATIGEDGLLLPDTMPAQEIVVPAFHSKPVKAAPLQMRENAVTNILYLAVEEGLIDHYVYSLLEDQRGNLWFGNGKNSFTKYDGQYLTVFSSPKDLPEHTYNGYALLEDKDGRIWFGTKTGIACYNGNALSYYSCAFGKKYQVVNKLMQDSKGRIWFGTRAYGAVCFDGQSFVHFTREAGIGDKGILSLFEDSKGNLWFGTHKEGLTRFDGQHFTYFSTQEGLNGNAISCISEGQDGALWLGTYYNGFFRFDGATFSHYTEENGLSGNRVRSILEDKQGNLWIGTHNTALNKFDGKAFYHYYEGSGTKSSHAHTICEDSYGNIWFGTGEGLHRIGYPEFRHYSSQLQNSDILTIAEDKDNHIWFGLSGEPPNGVVQFRDSVFLQYTSDINGLEILESGVLTIESDRKGRLWMGLWNKEIFRLDGDILTKHQLVNHQNKNYYYVSSILEDSKNNIWIGTNMGLIVFSEVALPSVPPYPSDVQTPVSPNTLTETQQSDIWFGTSRYLVSFNEETFTYYTSKEGLSSSKISTIHKNSKGHLWIGTDEGLNYFDGQQFSKFPQNDELLSQYVYSIVEDKEGRVWVGSNAGLSLLVPLAASEKATSQEQKDYKVLRFTKEDGLKQSDLMYGTLLDSKNRIWWGKTKGVMMLDLNDFELPENQPRIYLDHIELAQQFIDYRRLADPAYRQSFDFGNILTTQSFDSVAAFFNYPINLRLPYQLNHLTFHFSGIDWAASHHLRYSFRIQGLENDWSLPQPEAYADYRNLPHGTHTLEVKAIGAAQKWSEPFAYTFTIQPPWWLSWWAYALYSILGMMILAALLLYQRRRFKLQANLQLEQERAERLKELDRFKSRFYTNITHEFRTPLTVIKGISNQIDGQEKIKALIQRNSNRLLSLVNQLLDLSKLETQSLSIDWVQGDIIPYLQYLTESCHSLAGSKNINLAFFSNEDHLIMDFDENKLQQILINLLSNAIKFTPEYGSAKVIAGQVIEKGAPFLELAVKDTGKGIPREKLANIFNRFYQIDDSTTRQGEGSGIGLALVKELVQLLGGSIEVESEVGKGSAFTVFLPVHQNAEQAVVKDWARQPAISEGNNGLDNEQTEANSIPNDEEKPLVLIIEDNADVTEYIISCLAADYNLQTAPNGKIGIEKALEMVPDVILSDVMMPEMDGFEVCRHLKTDRRTSHIPIVLLTAKATQADKVSGLSHGADAYLTKPFDKEELLVRLHNLAALSQRLRERLSNIVPATEAVSDVESKEAIFLKEVNEIIDSKLSDELFDTNHLCRAIAMSRTQLHRKLKALTGQSTASYIRTFRLKKAKSLLESTDLPIGEIASEIGYKDFSHFSRSFLKEFGVQPSETRK